MICQVQLLLRVRSVWDEVRINIWDIIFTLEQTWTDRLHKCVLTPLVVFIIRTEAGEHVVLHYFVVDNVKMSCLAEVSLAFVVVCTHDWSLTGGSHITRSHRRDVIRNNAAQTVQVEEEREEFCAVIGWGSFPGSLAHPWLRQTFSLLDIRENQGKNPVKWTQLQQPNMVMLEQSVFPLPRSLYAAIKEQCCVFIFMSCVRITIY